MSQLAISFIYILLYLFGTSGSVLVRRSAMSDFESHLVPHSFNLVPHISKTFSKLLLISLFLPTHWPKD